MKRFIFALFIVTLSMSHHSVYSESSECLSPQFLGGQSVVVTGSVDAGGLPFRDDPELSEPVNGFIPIGTMLQSKQMLLCNEGRNWYTVLYAENENEEPDEVWVMDGDGHTYWLEPEMNCAISEGRFHIFPSFPAYTNTLSFDSFDETTNTIRFAARYYPPDRTASVEWHYFTLNLDTGLSTKTDYWYQDFITRDLTDRLGITEAVFGASNDFRTIFVSPDLTKILYLTTNPERQDCAHGCVTQTLWIADIDGSNPIALSEIYGGIQYIIWGDNGMLFISLSPIEVWGPDFTLAVSTDGTYSAYSDELILAERSLPFEYVRHMPVWSPDGEWIAVTMGSEQLILEGTLATGVIVENGGNQFIQLPYNGNVASPILWIDNDTILYPVQGIDWSREDLGLPRNFYSEDGLWEIHLDFETLTYQVGDRRTYQFDQNYDPMFNSEETHYILTSGDDSMAIIFSWFSLDIYCLARG